MKLINNSFGNPSLIKLKDLNWLAKQRIAGKIAAKTLLLLEKLVSDKTTKSLIELDKIAEEFILQNGGLPTFKGYKGFPNSCCISVGKNLVHGIPTSYKLQEGDLVSFDLGVTIDGVIADTAITCIYGDPKSEKHVELIKATDDALIKAIQVIKVGERLGIIGHTIYHHAKKCGFSVIEKYGGHGIDITDDGVGIPHAAPFVNNKSNLNEGIRIQPGLVIAIEPLFVLGSSTRTRVLDDGWTVQAENINSHAEHSIFVHENSVEIVTDRTNL